ncbi:caspase family protein [bacterium]|nr:caspase family protein [bacterium]
MRATLLTMFSGWMLLGFASEQLRGAEPNEPSSTAIRQALEYQMAPMPSLEAPVMAKGNEADDEDCNIVVAARDNRPLLVLNTGGPQSTLRAITFSPDSSRMYTGGLDKVVQVWGFQIEERGIRRTARNRAIMVQNLRWEIERGPNGQLYGLAASPTGRDLALAGFNTRVTDKSVGGDIVIYDTERGEVSRVLHEHSNPVVSVNYASSGERIVSSARNGEVIVWRGENGWKPEIINKAGEDIGVFVPVAFLDDDHVIFPVKGEKKGEWKIALGDVLQPNNPPTILDQIHSNAVTSIAVDQVNKRFATSDLTGDGKGTVYVWSGFSKPEAKKLRDLRLALSMDFDPTGRLFVSTALFNYRDGSRQSALEMWDVVNGKMTGQVEVSNLENAYVCKVSPDGSRVALFAGDNAEIRVYLLRERDGSMIEKPLEGSPLRLRGHGRVVQKVAFANNGSYRLGFNASKFDGKKEIPITEGFDLGEMKTIEPETVKGTPWINQSEQFPGWTASIEDRGSRVVIKNGMDEWTEIHLKANIEGLARSYTFIPAKAGGRPFGIAIGTVVQDWVLVYEIKATDTPCKLVRTFRDHAGGITSLSVSSDGKYLASGSLDQTIKVWSLEGLQKPEERFGPAPAWGASFVFDDGKIVVKNVIESGTAFRKGLRENDIVLEARFVPQIMNTLGIPADKPVTEARSILRGLEESPLTELLLLTVERHGSRLNRQILMIPAWSPVVTLFVDDRGEWAAFTPQGYFDASIAGEELFGWQLNRGQARKPDFFRADQFRRQLERPKAMRQLFSVGSIQEALRKTDEAPDEDDAVVKAAKKTPRITIVSPTDAAELKESTVPLVARIEYPDESSADKAASIAYVNGVPGKEVSDKRNGTDRTFEWSASVYDTYNRLRVVAEDQQKDSLAFADVHFRLRGPASERRPRMHLFMLAVSKYEHVDKLEFPVKDAEAIVEVLRKKSGELYDLGKVTTLYDEKASRDEVDHAIEDWKKTLTDARPDDVLVVFLAGHGIAVDNLYYFVPSKIENPTMLASDGISWNKMRELSTVPCKKIFLLDTCHSGNVLPVKEALAENLKSAIRPLKQDEIMVISATDAGQEALEIASLGHGVFTQAVLDGFQGAADQRKDQEIYLQELANFVEAEVPRRTRDLQLQTPRSYPSDLMDAISVPLVTLR